MENECIGFSSKFGLLHTCVCVCVCVCVYIYIYIYRERERERIEYYSAIKRNKFESVIVRWMNLEPVINSDINQRRTNKAY